MTLPRPIVAGPQFILATRDTGYRSVPAAIAELIDNAVQAQASKIRIFVREEQPLRASPSRDLTIGVLDDGQGMDHERLWTAIQFGGTERFNDRSGLGRFGMGLPNSSVSVTRRLEVYSWRRPADLLFTYLDIDEVARPLAGIPEPHYRPLPLWAAEAVASTGTLIVWPRCDRLHFKRASTIAEKLRAPLGRLYRRHIWQGLEISVNGEPVIPVDPLFRHPETGSGGASAYGAPLSYDIALPGERSSRITVRFTELPVARWHARSVEEKHAAGIVGGAGVSFLRAGREIDYCWQLFGGKRRENYDDWWRCEISFEPDLDEYFGVTHSKQGISPTPYLRSIVEPDLEATARILNARVRAAFETVKRSAPSKAAVRATRQERLLPPVSTRTKSSGLSYAIATAALPTSQFFTVTRRKGRLKLTINTDHPFYEQLYAPAVADPSGRQRHAIESLILAAGRTFLSISRKHGGEWASAYCESWSDTLAAFLETKRVRS